ncbi:MAG: hypothetical protein IKT26_07620 [Bacteroidaceae bacterium]|nr:hypothetical protein [Bacteroidaceae bacterium]
MKNFSLQRFTLLLRRDLFENWKSHFKYIGLFYIAILILEMFILWIDTSDFLEYSNRSHFVDAQLRQTCDITSCLFYLWAIVGTSYTFCSLNTQAKRTGHLMLPATKCEKFVSNVLIYSIIWWVGSIIAIFAADLTRYILLLPTEEHYPLIGKHMSEHLGRCCSNIYQLFAQTTWSIKDLSKILFLVLLFPWTGSTFLLGSSIFRKRPLILTVLSLCIAWGLFFSLSAFIVDICGNTLSIEYNLNKAEAPLYIFILIFIFLILCFVNLFLSYRIFGRTQIIGHRWWELRKSKR